MARRKYKPQDTSKHKTANSNDLNDNFYDCQSKDRQAKNLSIIKQEFIDKLTIENLAYIPGYSFKETRSLEFLAKSPKNKHKSYCDTFRMYLPDIDLAFVPKQIEDTELKIKLASIVILNYMLLNVLYASSSNQLSKHVYEKIAERHDTARLLDILDEFAYKVEESMFIHGENEAYDKDLDNIKKFVLEKMSKVSYVSNRYAYGIYPEIESITLTIPPFLYLPAYKLRFYNVLVFTQFLFTLNIGRFTRSLIDSSINALLYNIRKSDISKDGKKTVFYDPNIFCSSYVSSTNSNNIEILDVTYDNLNDVVAMLCLNIEDASKKLNAGDLRSFSANAYIGSSYSSCKEAYGMSLGFIPKHNAIDSLIEDNVFEDSNISINSIKSLDNTGEMLEKYKLGINEEILSKLHSSNNTAFWNIDIAYNLCVDKKIWDKANAYKDKRSIINVLETELSQSLKSVAKFDDEDDEDDDILDTIVLPKGSFINILAKLIASYPKEHISKCTDDTKIILNGSSPISSLSPNLSLYVNISDKLLPSDMATDIGGMHMSTIKDNLTQDQQEYLQNLLDCVIKPLLANQLLEYSFNIIGPLPDYIKNPNIHKKQQDNKKNLEDIMQLLDDDDQDSSSDTSYVNIKQLKHNASVRSQKLDKQAESLGLNSFETDDSNTIDTYPLIKVKDLDLSDKRQLDLLKENLINVYGINDTIYLKEILLRNHINSLDINNTDKTLGLIPKIQLLTVTLNSKYVDKPYKGKIKYPHLVDIVSTIITQEK